MEIEHRRLHRVDVLAISGRIQAPEAIQLQEKVNQLFAEGRFRLLLDLSQLEYISSPGLRVLIEARKRAREWKLTDFDRGDVRIRQPATTYQGSFRPDRITSLFHIYDDLVEAVGSF